MAHIQPVTDSRSHSTSSAAYRRPIHCQSIKDACNPLVITQLNRFSKFFHLQISKQTLYTNYKKLKTALDRGHTDRVTTLILDLDCHHD